MNEEVSLFRPNLFLPMVANSSYDVEGVVAARQSRIIVSFVMVLAKVMNPVVWYPVFTLGIQQADVSLNAKPPVLGFVVQGWLKAQVKVSVFFLAIDHVVFGSPTILSSFGQKGDDWATFGDDAVFPFFVEMVLEEQW